MATALKAEEREDLLAPGLKSWLGHLLTVSPWAGHLTSLSHKRGIKIIAQAYEMIHCDEITVHIEPLLQDISQHESLINTGYPNDLNTVSKDSVSQDHCQGLLRRVSARWAGRASSLFKVLIIEVSMASWLCSNPERETTSFRAHVSLPVAAGRFWMATTSLLLLLLELDD